MSGEYGYPDSRGGDLYSSSDAYQSAPADLPENAGAPEHSAVDLNAMPLSELDAIFRQMGNAHRDTGEATLAAAVHPSPAPAAQALTPVPATQQSIKPVVKVERVPVSDDTDTLTKQTIAKMCEYIGAGIGDPMIQGIAQSAWARLAPRGRDPEGRMSAMTDPTSIAWAEYWFVKHRLRRRLDEASLWRMLGPRSQSIVDMLTAPAVLIRMQEPVEDCDGFTMLLASLLGVFGLDQVIVTVACDARDRTRWSHVFGMVRTDAAGPGAPGGSWLALDCSHGVGPGWMVPSQQIFRWQAWNLKGEPVDVQAPARRAVNMGTMRPGA